MPLRLDQIDAPLIRLEQLLGGMTPSASMKPAIERWRSDAAALRFHLIPHDDGKPLVVAVIGGTGTGKSTLVNRLLGVDASAVSFRRTYTAGPVAIAREPAEVPRGWLGVEHLVVAPDKLPARGQTHSLLIVPRSALPQQLPHETLLNHAVLVDTPDLDGDQPVHHAEAERAFRWAQALIFLVTPEKYQMTELLPYYRLAARYAVPALFVMNKCEEQAVLEDYRGQVAGGEVGRQGDKEMGRRGDRETRRQGDTEMQRQDGAMAGKVDRASPSPDLPAPPSHGFPVSASPPLPVSVSPPLPVSVSPPLPVSLSPPLPVSLSPHPLFAVPRDDAAYDAPAGENLVALREAISTLSLISANRDAGLRRRAGDLVGRFEDQVLSPLREQRREADRLVNALRDMETPAPGVDVNPVTQDLERRLQQRSVLYLMGPQRVLDRVRQAPAMLVRLPRVAWDYVIHGQASAGIFSANGNSSREAPDFTAMLSDQFSVLQSRIDDLLRTSPTAQKWTAAGGAAYDAARISPESAGKIAEEELADLRNFLEKRWNATPRDTRIVQSLLKHLPGGKKLTALAESAPYLLTIALIAHHALFGTDLLVLGGYTIATWLTERLSNEVASRTRTANTRIADRFTRLAHEQIQKMCAWINHQAVAARTLDQLDDAAVALAKAGGVAGAEGATY